MLWRCDARPAGCRWSHGAIAGLWEATVTRIVAVFAIACALGVFGGCGEEVGGRQVRSGMDQSSVALLDRPSRARDMVPFARNGPGLEGIEVSWGSSRFAGVTPNGYLFWIAKGRRAMAGIDRSVVCLMLFSRVGTPIAAKCDDLHGVDGAGAVTLVLGGGRSGAPGFRAREVLIVGVVPRSIRRVRFADNKVSTPLGVFAVSTRAHVDSLVLRDQGGRRHVQPIVGCQNC